MDVEELDQLGEVGKRSRQPVYFIDDNDVDLSGRDADSCGSRPSERDDVARRNGMMPPTITR